MDTLKKDIQMVDLRSQYLRIKPEVDQVLHEVIDSTRFIGGPKVQAFQEDLAQYLGVKHVIPCANGTDALQIALMALGLQPGDEVIVPSFTYVATAEVIGLLNLTPIMVDVDPESFNVTAELIAPKITAKTKAIVPVHLFGQSADMSPIMALARQHNIFVVEDNAQAIGADYQTQEGHSLKTGTIGDIGCTSFFPSKNLGCYGDGGAMFTNDDELAAKIRMVANHGQNKRYHHAVIGCNSRLDAMQAAILGIKLRHLDDYSRRRQEVARRYDEAFAAIDALQTPHQVSYSSHVFHQYTMRVKSGNRAALQSHLEERGVPSMIYYPIPLYRQEAFKSYWKAGTVLPTTERLCEEVLSLPIHTEMEESTQDHIIAAVKSFFQ